jgi:TRAP transporter TAXI family solute receptor
LVFDAYGFREGDLAATPFIANELPNALARGAADLMFATAYYPAQTVTEATQAGAKLLPIDGDVAEQLRHTYPFVRRVSIPAHTYPGQPTAVETIGVDRLFVCRNDLDEGVVYDLTQRFFEALSTIFSTPRVSTRLMDLDRASATPIPLHRGAAQYYRELELRP